MKSQGSKFLIGLLFSAAALAGPGAPEPAASPEIRWQDWSDSAFARAKAEKRLVILDLVAVWCHWCHVMEETTYRDPEVVRQLRGHFVALRVDQDSRPDLSNRYEDYGWPATVIFDADGRELVKFAGYIPPSRMRTLLEGVVADPTPGPSVRPEAPLVPSATALSPELRQELAALLVQRYDKELGGWGFSKKYLDWDSVEYCLSRAREGDAGAERMAFETLDGLAQADRPGLGRAVSVLRQRGLGPSTLREAAPVSGGGHPPLRRGLRAAQGPRGSPGREGHPFATCGRS